MNPSLRACVTAFCLRCRSDDLWAVANCDQLECSLHPVRPNQRLQGQTPADFALDEVRQEILDALDLQGLQEITDVRSCHSSSSRPTTRTGHPADRAIHARRAEIERVLRARMD